MTYSFINQGLEGINERALIHCCPGSWWTQLSKWVTLGELVCDSLDRITGMDPVIYRHKAIVDFSLPGFHS